jgi:DNA primase
MSRATNIFKFEGRTIGYTARAFTDGVKPKYYSHYEPNFVFNMNNQHSDSKFVIVCEGPFDAMSVDGVAVLNNECNETQADIIESLGREVIVVADKDRAGAKMINNAIEYGWSVSFPVWLETSKDINEAVCKYGKLFVLKSILDAKHSSKLKIELMRKKLYN